MPISTQFLAKQYFGTPERRDQTARTIGGGLESITESTFNLLRSITEATPLPTAHTALLPKEQQDTLMAAQLSQDPNLQTEEQRSAQKQSKLEAKQNAQYFLQDLYEAALGEQNVEMQQRGDVMSPTIKRPEGIGANLAREGISLGTALLSVKKITNPAQTLKDIKNIPTRVGKIKATAKKVGEGYLKAEAVGQLAIDPMQNNLANVLGDAIPDDSWLSDIETYLLNPIKYEQGDTELEARLKMGAESFLLGGALYAGFGAGKFIIKGGKKVPIPKINVPDAFLQSLKDVREGGKEAVSDFLKVVKRTYKGKLPGSKIKATLKERRRRAEKRGDVPKGAADVKALETGGLGKLLFDINTRYAENPYVRNVVEYLRGLSPRQGVSVQIHEAFLRQLGLKDEAFATITHISRNIEREVNSLSDGLFSGELGRRKVFGKEAKNRREKIMNQVDRVLYTDFRFPAVKTSKGFQPAIRQKEAFAKQLKLLPAELREPVKRLRMYRDDLSEALARNPYTTAEQAEKITSQLGFYIKKSYKLREAGKWHPSSSLEKAAKIDIRTQFLKYSPSGKELNKRLTTPKGKNETVEQFKLRVDSANKELDTAVDNVINTLKKSEKDTDYFTIMGTKDNKRNQDLIKQLKERMEMPKSVEEFLGRIDDPLGKFEISAAETVRTLGDLQFYKEAHNLGRGLYIFKRKGTAPKGFNVQIPEGHGDLSGMYTSDSFARFIQNINETSLFLGQGRMASIMRTLSLFKAGTHLTKTVFSYGTQIVNVLGAVGSAIANGNNIFSKQFINGIKVVAKKGSATGDLRYQAMIEEGARYGLWGKNILASEFALGVKEFTKVRKGKSAMYLEKIYKGTGAKQLIDTFTDIYRGGDEFVKWGMWKQETKFFDKINDVLPSNSKFDKYRIADTKQEAANTVNAVVQNYDFLPRALKWVRGIPVVSTFFSFSAESIRMLVNSVRKVGQELKLGHQMKRDGATEAGNLMIARGTRRGAALTAFGAVTYGGVVSKATDEEREQEAKEIYSQILAPEFYGGSQNFAIRVDKNDIPIFTPTDRSNPYNVSKSILTAAMQWIHSNDPLKYNPDEDLGSVMRDVILREAEVLTGESLLKDGVGTYFSYKENGQGYEFYGDKKVLMKNPYDPTHVFDRSGSHMENITNRKNLELLIARIADTYEPGSATTILRYNKNLKETKTVDTVTGEPTNPYGEQIDLINENIGLATSIRGFVYNTDRATREYKQAANTFKTSRKELKYRLSSALKEGYTPEDYKKLSIEVNQQYFKLYRKFAKHTYAVNWLNNNYKGIDANAETILRENGIFSKDESLALGYIGTSEITYDDKGKGQGDIFNNKGVEYFVPLALTDNDLEDFINAEFNNTAYDSLDEALATYNIVTDEIYKELSSLPVYVHQNDKEALEEVKNYNPNIFKDLKKRYLKFEGGNVAIKEDSEKESKKTLEEEITITKQDIAGVVSNMKSEKPPILKTDISQDTIDEIFGPMGANKVTNPVEERKQKFQGGELSPDYPVPNTKQNPAERIDKNTGLPYDEPLGRLGFKGGGLMNGVEDPLARLGFTGGGGLMVSIGVAPVSEKQMSKFEKALKKRKAKREGGRIGFNYGGDDQDYSNPVLGLDERAKEYEEAWRPDVGDRDPQADPFQNLSAEAAQDWEMEHGAQIVSNYRDAQIAGDVAADDDDNNILQAVAPVTELSAYETNYNYFLPLWNSAVATNAKLSNAIQGGYENMGRITKRLIKNRTTSIFNKDDNYYILPGLNPNTTEEWGSEDEKRDWIGQSVESGTIAGYSNPEEAEIDREEMFEQLVNREDLDQPRDNKEAEPEPEPNQTKEEHRGGGASGGLFRNYKKEYANYQSQPEQKKNRAGRNAARRSLLKSGRVNKGDGKDVDHRDGNPRNNSPSNLLVKPKSSNRSFSRRLKARNGGLLDRQQYGRGDKVLQGIKHTLSKILIGADKKDIDDLDQRTIDALINNIDKIESPRERQAIVEDIKRYKDGTPISNLISPGFNTLRHAKVSYEFGDKRPFARPALIAKEQAQSKGLFYKKKFKADLKEAESRAEKIDALNNVKAFRMKDKNPNLNEEEFNEEFFKQFNESAKTSTENLKPGEHFYLRESDAIGVDMPSIGGQYPFPVRNFE